ncbi:alpha/beta fold hydrolase [Sporosarcina sp.]|uniref:thioesterase II family protein n=1 Tax=Sporosarcina sp. TaxID=49982 RepID=UPI00262F54BA|nr:alpha/beta fold hydrolase [Sporosarcina sp.]
MDIKLIRNCEKINKNKITLFCFPFAGGGASVYNQWINKMQEEITVCPIQLPGREERIMEKPYMDMKMMLEDLTEQIKNVIKGKYALWGHSMGSKIAYELEKHMEKDGYQAQCLFVSGSRIPSIPEPNPIYYLSDNAFKKELGRFEGTPKEILESKELLDFFLPMLRADFTLDETYYDEVVTKLRSPIMAFGGDKDREADEEAIRRWNNYTDNTFGYEIFEGGHFYLWEHEDEVIQQISECLKRLNGGN